MSGIHARGPLAAGMDAALLALQRAQDRLGVTGRNSQGGQAAQSAPPSARDGGKPSPLVPPPNPGPPGGAVPATLTEAMAARNREAPRPGPEQPSSAVTEKLALRDVSATVQTVQAFDAMLHELTRLTPREP